MTYMSNIFSMNVFIKSNYPFNVHRSQNTSTVQSIEAFLVLALGFVLRGLIILA